MVHSDESSDDERRYDSGGSNSETDDDHKFSDEEGQADRIEEIDLSNASFCSIHKPGEMTRDCATCSAALAAIKPKIADQLLASGPSSDILSKYSKGRCDEVKPTLSLSDNVFRLAKNIFTKGAFRDKKAFPEITKNFLTLPQSQHRELTADIRAEDIFQRYRKEKRFTSIFKFQGEMQHCLQTLRISQRPMFSMIEETNSELISLRKFGEEVGLIYKENAPLRTGDFVPRDIRKIPNNLSIDTSAGLYPTPDPAKLFSMDLNSPEGHTAIKKHISEYRNDCGIRFIQLHDQFAKFLNKQDDRQIFWADLYSNADAGFRELIRERLANLFKSDLRTEILSASSSKKREEDDKKEPPKGLFGGDRDIKASLKSVTKHDAYLRKAVVNSYDKKRSTQDYGSYSRSESKRARSRSRSRPRSKSRSRSRSPARGHRGRYDYNSSSGKRQRKFSKAKKSGDDSGGGSSSSKSDKKSHNKKGTIPTSFCEAWYIYL